MDLACRRSPTRTNQQRVRSQTIRSVRNFMKPRQDEMLIVILTFLAARSPRARGFLDKVASKVAHLTVSPPNSPPIVMGNAHPRFPRRSSSVDSISESIRLRRSSSSNSAVTMGNKQRIVPELASLMIYTAGVKYRGFSKLVEYKPEEMFSVSEKVGTKILKATPLDFIKHNRGHLSRVYPHGTRLTSKNYLPHHFWAMGAQLVALNWQTCGM